MGERLAGSQKVRGSSPLSSIPGVCRIVHKSADPCKLRAFLRAGPWAFCSVLLAACACCAIFCAAAF